MQKKNKTGGQLNSYAISTIFKVSLVGYVVLLAVTTCVADELPAIVRDGMNDKSANSRNLWISAGMISYHFNREAGQRDLNWGYGIQSNLSANVSVLGGTYINTKDARSNYLGMAWQPLVWHSVQIGLEVGVIDGYPDIHHGGYLSQQCPV